MRTFRYTAADATGAIVSGHALASNELELDSDLEARGLFLARARETGHEGRAASGRLSRRELVLITSQLATVCGGGVPIVEGLDGLARGSREPRVKALLELMISRLQAGAALSQVLDELPGSFPPVYRASVRAGEAAGALAPVLGRLTRHLEWVQAMRATTAQALVYPGILFSAICGLVAILLYHVLPKVLNVLPGGVQDLPATTRTVLAVSGFVTSNAITLATALAAAALGLVLALRLPRPRSAVHRAFLALPFLGPLAAKIATSRFASTASTLQTAGCDVMTLLSVAAETSGNAAMREAFERAAADVRLGAPISEALAKEPLIDPLLVQMVGVGEKTGQLDLALERLAQHYDEDLPRSVKRTLTFLEPGMLAVTGVVVAFILLAAMLPFFEMYDRFG